MVRVNGAFIENEREHLDCKLKHNLYGLKQSPKCWNHTLDTCLKSMGFIHSTSDPCIYTSSIGEMCLIGVYVDDNIIVLDGQSLMRIKEVKKALSLRFNKKVNFNYFLGVQVFQNNVNGYVWIGQPTFTDSILKNYGVEKQN